MASNKNDARVVYVLMPKWLVSSNTLPQKWSTTHHVHALTVQQLQGNTGVGPSVTKNEQLQNKNGLRIAFYHGV
jgi:hypothetical protein